MITHDEKRARRPMAIRKAGPTLDVKILRLQCSLCNAITILQSKKPREISRDKTTKPVPALEITQEPKALPSLSANSNSPKLANSATSRKTRGKKTSLQALLAASQQQQRNNQPTAKRGLDLMDFMKP
ncbi:hypothetical protein LTR29_002334 [Friedmanniomyces endolithicus]|nr:hypothetical protein LTR29_002334 [Friedmanniomyces endolithicus]